MTYLQLRKLIKSSGMSYEEFGAIVGVSGMTLRRWLKRPAANEVPKFYLPALREACYQLIAEGKLPATSEDLIPLLQAGHQTFEYQAVMRVLGLENDTFSNPVLGSGAEHEELWVRGLSQIGHHKQKAEEVDRSKEKIFSFKKLGKNWSKRIQVLWKVITSSKYSSAEKLVAYGALFYLLSPIDFIPDHIPVIGLLDDFAILGIATSFYLRRYGEIE